MRHFSLKFLFILISYKIGCQCVHKSNIDKNILQLRGRLMATSLCSVHISIYISYFRTHVSSVVTFSIYLISQTIINLLPPMKATGVIENLRFFSTLD